MFNSWNETNGKDKLSDFVERFWHFDLITSMSLEEFTEKYIAWAKEKNTTEADPRLSQSMISFKWHSYTVIRYSIDQNVSTGSSLNIENCG